MSRQLDQSEASAQRREARRAALEHRQRQRHGEVEAAPGLESRPLPEVSLKQTVEPVLAGITRYIGLRIELLKHEALDNVRDVGRDAIGLAVAVSVLLVGYVMLNAGIALLVGALAGGLMGVALAALGLGLLHLIPGGIWALVSLRRLKAGPFDLALTRAELEKDVQWLKEIQATRALAAPKEPPALPEGS